MNISFQLLLYMVMVMDCSYTPRQAEPTIVGDLVVISSYIDNAFEQLSSDCNSGLYLSHVYARDQAPFKT